MTQKKNSSAFDEVFASLKKKEFSISESDGARWLAIYVCVNLTGRLTTPATVQLGTVAGSAEGIIINYIFKLTACIVQ